MNKFRPQDIDKLYIMKQRRLTGRSENYSWQSRIKWYPAGWGFNKRVLGSMHSRLHYLACHAPTPVQKKWAKTYKVFMDKHFGDTGKATIRYLNKWSCHSWM